MQTTADHTAKPAAGPAAKAGAKAADIHVLRCLNPECRGLLAYEVDSRNVLYLDLGWTARSAGETRYFPCPKCGGRNVLEDCTNDKGQARHRVVRWEARETGADELELIPRRVRDKLDRVGIKVHLREWQAMSQADRRLLCDLPCSAADEVAGYAASVVRLVREVTGKDPDRL